MNGSKDGYDLSPIIGVVVSVTRIREKRYKNYRYCKDLEKATTNRQQEKNDMSVG